MDMIPITSTSSSNEGQHSVPIWRQTFDPKSRIMINWNRFMFVIRFFNLGIDLFIFFILRVDGNSVAIDFRLAYIISSLRMMGDSCQFLGIIVKFRTAIADPANGVFKRQGLVKDPVIIAERYLKSSFIIDLIATLPLMQTYLSRFLLECDSVKFSSWVYLWCKLPSLRTLSTIYSILDFSEDLIGVFFVQFLSRFYVLFPSRKNSNDTGDIITRPAWSGALYFLLFYIMLSQFTGAVYYFLYIYCLLKCKRIVSENQANSATLGWEEMLRNCGSDNQLEPGMFSDIYKNKIGSRSFTQRYMYCFSWGLKCLSSMGQNFDTSASLTETLFSFCTTIFGLVLFAGLIAQMQTCIQSMEPGEEQQMVRQREVEEWAKNHQLPPELKKHLRKAVESDLRALRCVDDDTMLGLLPSDLQCDIRRHLYYDRACNLPFIANMDSELARSFIGHLRTLSCSKDTFVIIEGEPVKFILFIFSGELEISSIKGGSSDSTLLRAGDLCGSELLAWASLPSASNQNLPLSSQSAKCLTDVEAFSIFAEDLKLLGIQFNHCWKFKQVLIEHS